MSPRISIFIAAFTAFLLEMSTLADAAAQVRAASDHAESSEARERYRQGVRAFASGRYPEAIQFFRDADRKEPSAALSFDMARAYEKLGDDAGALRSYRDYLRRSRHPDDEREIGRLVTSLSARLAERGVQQVTVLSTPPGATVSVDGEAVGVTPWTSEITPGAHSLVLRLEGWTNAERRIDVPANDALDVQVTLQQEPEPQPVTSPVRAETPRTLAPPPLPPSAAPTPEPPSRPLRTVGIAALSVGGAALGTAVVFELLRSHSEQQARDEHEQIRLAEDLHTMESQRTTARIFAGTGAGLAVLGGVFWLVSPTTRSPQDRSAQVKLNVTACAISGTVSGRF